MTFPSILTGFLITIWLVGIVLAKGFWMTLLAITIPFVGMYLAVEAYLIPLLNKLITLL